MVLMTYLGLLSKLWAHINEKCEHFFLKPVMLKFVYMCVFQKMKDPSQALSSYQVSVAFLLN